MTDDLLYLVVMCALLAASYHWWRTALQARETANSVARDTCSRAVVQLLDDTVAFAGCRWDRDSRGKRRLLWTYTFDYSNDGQARSQGFVIITRGRLHAVGLQAGTA